MQLELLDLMTLDHPTKLIQIKNLSGSNQSKINPIAKPQNLNYKKKTKIEQKR